AFDERWICVVQAKALSVLAVDPDRSTARWPATVTKDIRDGLKQLVGAMKRIRSDAAMFDAEDRPLVLPDRKKTLAHAIVIISEMSFFGDWKKMALTLAETSHVEAHKAMFHVMDLMELSAMTVNCESSEMFFNRLMQRWVFIQDRGTAYVRGKAPPPGYSP